jgi:hypothetical protein
MTRDDRVTISIDLAPEILRLWWQEAQVAFTREVPCFSALQYRRGANWPLDRVADFRQDSNKTLSVSVASVEDLLASIHLARLLGRPRSKLRDLVKRCFPEQDLPFNFVVLAVLARRVRSLRPRPALPLVRSITSIELRWARVVLALAEVTAAYLVTAVTSSTGGELCRHCKQRFAAVGNVYCSVECRKAANNRRMYLKSAGTRQPERHT